MVNVFSPNIYVDFWTVCITHECCGQPAFFFRNQNQRLARTNLFAFFHEKNRFWVWYSNSCDTWGIFRGIFWTVCITHECGGQPAFFLQKSEPKACKARTLTLLTEKCIALFFATICLWITITKVESFLLQGFSCRHFIKFNQSCSLHLFCINHFALHE